MNQQAVSHPVDHGQPSTGAGSIVPFALAGFLCLGIAYGGLKWWQVREFETARAQGPRINIEPVPLCDFTLDERGGAAFHSSEMRGKVWVVSYFFASCIGPCRILNGNIQELTNYPDLKDVTWVSITCDPDNDSLPVLKQYASQYGADPQHWLFCRGDLDYLKGVARGMNMPLAMKTHSDTTVVVDRAGTIRAMFDGTSKHECQQMRVLLHECLAEKPPAAAEETKTTDFAPATDSVPITNSASLRDFAPANDPALDCCEDEPAQPALRSGGQ